MTETTNVSKGTSISTILKNKAKFEGYSKEKIKIKEYFTISTPQYLIIMCIAVIGVLAIISTYNAIQSAATDIRANYQECKESDDLKSALDAKFWVILVLSAFIIVVGAVLTWFLRSSSQYRLLTLGLITLGILGILFSFIMKFRAYLFSLRADNATIWITPVVLWLLFVVFIILGYVMGKKSKKLVEAKSVSGTPIGAVVESVSKSN